MTSDPPVAESRGKLNIGPALRGFYGEHRSGLRYGLEHLGPLHSRRGVLLDAFVDISFGSGSGEGPRHLRPWVGMIHIPHDMPPHYTPCQSNEAIFASSAWQESLPYCRGLFAMSEWHRRALAPRFPFAVSALFLPTETPDTTWSWERFLANRERRVVQVGWWLRELHAIHRLRVRGFAKAFLRVNHSFLDSLMADERRQLEAQGRFDPGMYAGVTTIPYVSNTEYDHLLSENVVLVKLLGASANNTIVECIARTTPVLVNPLDAVVEYLGREYPLYFDDLDEAARKAEDLDLIREAHRYLRDLPQRERLTGASFRDGVEESAVYRELVPEERPLMISVITPSLDSAAQIERAIQSVASQDHGPSEHIVVDRGSRDGTLEILQRYPHLRWLSEPGASRSQAMDTGFAQARGDAIAYLEAGDHFSPGAFRAVEPHFCDGAVFVAGRVLVKGEDGSCQISDPRVRHADILRYWEPDAHPVNPAGYFYLRQVQERVGGFCGRNHAAADLEFLMACSQRYEIRKIDTLLGVHEETRAAKQARRQTRAGYWTDQRADVAHRYLGAMPADYVRQYERDRRVAYRWRFIPWGLRNEEYARSRYHEAARNGRRWARSYWRFVLLRWRPGKLRLIRERLYQWLTFGRHDAVLFPANYSDEHWHKGIAHSPGNMLFAILAPDAVPASLAIGARLLFAHSGRARVESIGRLERDGLSHLFVYVDRHLEGDGDGYPNRVLVKSCRKSRRP